MHNKTEELLYMLLWTCEILSRPTWRNLTESYEGWAYRNGLLRQVQRLEQLQLLEHQSAQVSERLLRLTEAGRLQAQGGRDPVTCWSRPWDGRWRLALFDVPVNGNSARDKVRRYLQSRGFGYLQQSVWITPHPVDEERTLLANGPVDVSSFIMLEARPCAGESDEAIVTSAWDFEDINKRYLKYQQVLARRPPEHLITKAEASNFQRWILEERQAWLDALAHDPLLPECLLPTGYAGREAWRQRMKIMPVAGEQMRGFQGG